MGRPSTDLIMQQLRTEHPELNHEQLCLCEKIITSCIDLSISLRDDKDVNGSFVKAVVGNIKSLVSICQMS